MFNTKVENYIFKRLPNILSTGLKMLSTQLWFFVKSAVVRTIEILSYYIDILLYYYQNKVDIRTIKFVDNIKNKSCCLEKIEKNIEVLSLDSKAVLSKVSECERERENTALELVLYIIYSTSISSRNISEIHREVFREYFKVFEEEGVKKDADNLFSSIQDFKKNKISEYQLAEQIAPKKIILQIISSYFISILINFPEEEMSTSTFHHCFPTQAKIMFLSKKSWTNCRMKHEVEDNGMITVGAQNIYGTPRLFSLQSNEPVIRPRILIDLKLEEIVSPNSETYSKLNTKYVLLLHNTIKEIADQIDNKALPIYDPKNLGSASREHIFVPTSTKNLSLSKKIFINIYKSLDFVKSGLSHLTSSILDSKEKNTVDESNISTERFSVRNLTRKIAFPQFYLLKAAIYVSQRKILTVSADFSEFLRAHDYDPTGLSSDITNNDLVFVLYDVYKPLKFPESPKKVKAEDLEKAIFKKFKAENPETEMQDVTLSNSEKMVLEHLHGVCLQDEFRLDVEKFGENLSLFKLASMTAVEQIEKAIDSAKDYCKKNDNLYQYVSEDSSIYDLMDATKKINPANKEQALSMLIKFKSNMILCGEQAAEVLNKFAATRLSQQDVVAILENQSFLFLALIKDLDEILKMCR